MLFYIFGAGGAGKTASVRALRHLLPDVSWHAFDEIGVPRGADKLWRQRTIEYWLARAIEMQQHGYDMGLEGQAPYGEILASPLAERLEGIAGCLLDVEDVVRIDRLRARGSHAQATQDMLCGAAWNRMHAADPQWRPDVITDESHEGMRWERWRDWRRCDPRWRVQRLDTTRRPVEEVAAGLAEWVRAQRR